MQRTLSNDGGEAGDKDGDGVSDARRLLTDGGEDEMPEEEEEAEETDEGEEEEAEEEQDDAEGGQNGDGNAESEDAGEEEDEEAAGAPGATAEETYESEDQTSVLFLNLEGLFLDLLGLEVDLNEVTLSVSAAEGEGNLLGNLLSAVGGLLDNPLEGLTDNPVGDFLKDPVGSLLGGGEGEGLRSRLGGGDGGGIRGLLGSGGGEETEAEGEEGETGESSRFGGVGDALSDIPVQEILVQVVVGVVEQLLEPSEEDSTSGES